jgi:hypothetical protein
MAALRLNGPEAPPAAAAGAGSFFFSAALSAFFSAALSAFFGSGFVPAASVLGAFAVAAFGSSRAASFSAPFLRPVR